MALSILAAIGILAIFAGLIYVHANNLWLIDLPGPAVHTPPLGAGDIEHWGVFLFSIPYVACVWHGHYKFWCWLACYWLFRVEVTFLPSSLPPTPSQLSELVAWALTDLAWSSGSIWLPFLALIDAADPGWLTSSVTELLHVSSHGLGTTQDSVDSSHLPPSPPSIDAAHPHWSTSSVTSLLHVSSHSSGTTQDSIDSSHLPPSPPPSSPAGVVPPEPHWYAPLSHFIATLLTPTMSHSILA
ncbi:hypothetical protein FRC12_001746 [Ceratobasidium sp. 428]|nr:hypothetical protein FRC12_001746 [Ceratobasidium sp. 428]